MKYIEALPTWEEVQEFEYFRSEGMVNVFELNPALATLHGLKRLAAWLERCKKKQIPWPSLLSDAYMYYENIHGHKDTWITEELQNAFKMNALDAEMSVLKTKMAELRRKVRKSKEKK